MSFLLGLALLWGGVIVGFFLASMFFFGDSICKRCGSDKL